MAADEKRPNAVHHRRLDRKRVVHGQLCYHDVEQNSWWYTIVMRLWWAPATATRTRTRTQRSRRVGGRRVQRAIRRHSQRRLSKRLVSIARHGVQFVAHEADLVLDRHHANENRLERAGHVLAGIEQVDERGLELVCQRLGLNNARRRRLLGLRRRQEGVEVVMVMVTRLPQSLW